MEAAVAWISYRHIRQRAKTAEPDLKVLHAKIGQLTLENNFLEDALSGLRCAE